MEFEEVDYWEEVTRDHGLVRDPRDIYHIPRAGQLPQCCALTNSMD